jgi:hypothetical protein
MADDIGIFIDILSYLAGAWVAFKVYDARTKGTKGSHDLLLLVLLLLFVGGGGSALAYALKTLAGVS